MNRKAFVYLGLVSATLAGAFVYMQHIQQNQSDNTGQAAKPVNEEAQSLPAITVFAGKPGTPAIRIEAPAGQAVHFLIQADEDDTLDIPGLDMHIGLQANQIKKIQVPGNKTGSFEIELRSTGNKLGSINFYPTTSHAPK